MLHSYNLLRTTAAYMHYGYNNITIYTMTIPFIVLW